MTQEELAEMLARLEAMATEKDAEAAACQHVAITSPYEIEQRRYRRDLIQAETEAADLRALVTHTRTVASDLHAAYGALLASERAAMARVVAERDRMREAVEKHRDRIWGTEPVQHDEDVELYAACALAAPASGREVANG